MNKIDFDNPGGLPVYQDTLAFMQESYREGLLATLRALGLPNDQAVDLTINIQYSEQPNGDTQASWSDGLVYMAGDLLQVTAGSLTIDDANFFEIPLVEKQITTPPPLNPATYQQGQSYSPYKFHRGTLHRPQQAPGSALPLFNNLAFFLKDQAWQYVQQQLPAEDPWHTVGAQGEPAFNNPPNWSTTTPGGLSHPVQFRKTNEGVVRLRGAITSTYAIAIVKLFTLPPGYRPPIPLQFAATELDNNDQPIPNTLSTVDQESLQILPNGEVYAYTYAPNTFDVSWTV
jgi:hypothetical protein